MWMMLASQGMQSGLNGVADYITAKKTYKTRKAWQEYNNATLRIVDAQNQNAITTNVIKAMEVSSRKAFFQQRGTINTEGSARVAAGAAGVEGNSVNQTMFSIQQNAAYEEYSRVLDLEGVFLQAEHQRLQSATQAEYQQDRSYIPKPNLLNTALDIGSDFVGGVTDRLKTNPSGNETFSGAFLGGINVSQLFTQF